jgi:hypothetical protein
MLQHGEPADFLEIPIEIGFSRDRRGRATGDDIVLQVEHSWIGRRSYLRFPYDFSPVISLPARSDLVIALTLEFRPYNSFARHHEAVIIV